MKNQPRKKNGRFASKSMKSVTPPNAAPRLPKKGETVEKFFEIHKMRLMARMMESGYSRKRAAVIVSMLSDDDIYRKLGE